MIASVLLAAIAAFILRGVLQKPGARLLITVDGEVFGTYDLEEDQTIRIGDTNICRIEGGKAVMEWADCPDQICVHHKALDRSGGTIVCLPNRVVLSVEGGEKDGEVDAVT